jgi:hypothetical protein
VASQASALRHPTPSVPHCPAVIAMHRCGAHACGQTVHTTQAAGSGALFPRSPGTAQLPTCAATPMSLRSLPCTLWMYTEGGATTTSVEAATVPPFSDATHFCTSACVPFAFQLPPTKNRRLALGAKVAKPREITREVEAIFANVCVGELDKVILELLGGVVGAHSVYFITLGRVVTRRTSGRSSFHDPRVSMRAPVAGVCHRRLRQRMDLAVRCHPNSSLTPGFAAAARFGVWVPQCGPAACAGATAIGVVTTAAALYMALTSTRKAHDHAAHG